MYFMCHNISPVHVTAFHCLIRTSRCVLGISWQVYRIHGLLPWWYIPGWQMYPSIHSILQFYELCLLGTCRPVPPLLIVYVHNLDIFLRCCAALTCEVWTLCIISTLGPSPNSQILVWVTFQVWQCTLNSIWMLTSNSSIPTVVELLTSSSG